MLPWRLSIIPGEFIGIAGLQGQEFESEDGGVFSQVSGDYIDIFRRFGFAGLVADQLEIPVFLALGQQQPAGEFNRLGLDLERQRGRFDAASQKKARGEMLIDEVDRIATGNLLEVCSNLIMEQSFSAGRVADR